MNTHYSLNGLWQVDYLADQPYSSEEEPQLSLNSESVTSCPVPGYWEDLDELFRTTALYTKLRYNPLYTLQKYPQNGYCPDMALPNPIACLIYQKQFVLETLPDGESELFIGGAQNTVSAWINGQYLGKHEGYSTSFGFSIPTEALHLGENRVTLAVSNFRLKGYRERPVSGLTSRAANECTGGIYGDVELRVYVDGLKDVWVTTSEDSSSFTVHTTGAEHCRKTLVIQKSGEVVCETEIAQGKTDITLSSESYDKWFPETPNLYTVTVKTDHQTVSCRFGIRRLTVDGLHLRLNGKPFYFRGSCEHCYQPKTVHPTRDKTYYRMVIRKLKEFGFNAIRFHTWVPPYEYMEAADELGIVMEIESPNNTTFAEWHHIVRFCRHHAAVAMYSTGNELQIDFQYEDHLRACAKLVHQETDSLFSPMSAMRGIEYCFADDDEVVPEPILHNPKRLAVVDEFCDVYNSYSLGDTSYSSSKGTQPILDQNNSIYKKPLLSHEICIQGTYIDLSLEERYRGSRIGQTSFMSSVRAHLEEKGLIEKAPLYYRNSAAWQRLLRKHCFETVRRCKTFSGYDFLGDIDTHWHTFGYCVGMMNEFYELKPGETVENILRYNGETVLLADLPSCVNVKMGQMVEIPLFVSHYGENLSKPTLNIRVSGNGKVIVRKRILTSEIGCGDCKELYRLKFRIPSYVKPTTLRLDVSLSGGNTDCENTWNLYAFPKTSAPSSKTLCERDVVVKQDINTQELYSLLQKGKSVVVFGVGPFSSSSVSFQISLAGRTVGHLATVISDHPLMEDFPHEGYCGKQFESMLNESKAVVLDGLEALPHSPILDIASAYKNAHREAMLFEYRVDRGKLLVCTLNLKEDDPAAVFLKNRILSYAAGDTFVPLQQITLAQLSVLCQDTVSFLETNSNQAMNQNDITMCK